MMRSAAMQRASRKRFWKLIASAAQTMSHNRRTAADMSHGFPAAPRSGGAIATRSNIGRRLDLRDVL
jgi:hypothetical protein